MKKYSFRLEQVRRVRSAQENVAKAALLEANHGVMQAQQLIATRMSDYERSVAGPGAATSQAAFAKSRFFSELAYRRVLAAREAEVVARDTAELKRIAWAEAALKVKALDRLDERKREEYAIEYGRESAKELDDIVTSRAGESVTTHAQVTS